MLPGAMTLALGLALCSPASRPILAEVYYDALGDDTGLEFVEIFNPLGSSLSLSGLRLEAGDGSGPGRWTLRWTGGPADSVPAGGRFVVGGSRVLPRPQAIVELQLQNGPDAVRLVWGDGAVEVLGYGALEFPEYACGDPAPDVPSGRSLARIPDESELGSNLLDFRPASPTPGRVNQPRRDVAWASGSLALVPEQPPLQGSARLRGLITNLGREATAPGEVGLHGHTTSAFGDRVILDGRLEPALAPGDSAWLELPLEPLPEGKQTISCRLALTGDQAPENDTDSLLARVGPGPLELTEIQFHPAHGEGEWVEVRNRSHQTLDLGAFTLSDRRSTRGRPEPGRVSCPPESLALLAQDRAALLHGFPGLDTSRVGQVSPWPSLNNTDDASGFADAVVLRDQDGTLCARLDYSAAGVPAGVPLERQPGEVWGPALEAQGSPLKPPRAPPLLAGRFELTPRRISEPGMMVHLAWSLPWPRSRAAVDLYDLSGGRIGPIMPEAPVPARGERGWRPEGLTPGLYLLVLRARAESGDESLSVTRLLRVDGAGP